MKSVKRVLFRTLAIAAFTGLTIGGSSGLGRADSGLDTGAGGLGYQTDTESIEHSTGSGAGGSTDTGYSTGSGSSSQPSYNQGTDSDSNTGYGTGGTTDSNTGYGTGGTTDSNTGYGTGGSTDSNTGYGTGGSNDTGTGSSSGSGTGGSTNDPGSYRTDPNDASYRNGTTTGGVTYPDHSDVLGPSGTGYWRK